MSEQTNTEDKNVDVGIAWITRIIRIFKDNRDSMDNKDNMDQNICCNKHG